jgi:hypothetical protein
MNICITDAALIAFILVRSLRRPLDLSGNYCSMRIHSREATSDPHHRFKRGSSDEYD